MQLARLHMQSGSLEGLWSLHGKAGDLPIVSPLVGVDVRTDQPKVDGTIRWHSWTFFNLSTPHNLPHSSSLLSPQHGSMASNADDDAFDRKTEAFIDWFQRRPGATISPKIRVADLRQSNAGRGVGAAPLPPLAICPPSDLSLVAVEDIEDDHELFSVPHKDVLSVENSFLNASHPEIFKQLDSWNSLVLTMIYEDGQGIESGWWPYLNILPTDFDTLIYWTPEELAELQGSAVLAKIGKETAESSFIKILLPLVQKHWELFAAHAETFHGTNAKKRLVELAHRMATLIMACGFDLESEPLSEGEEEECGSSQQAYELNKGMVPLADMFNADGNLNNVR